MQGSRVLMRADASTGLGSGHVMRCLTLAGALRDRGADVRFICREEPGHLGERITAQGFGLTLLPAGLPLEERGDATATLEAMGDSRCDWMIVDHYALGAVWENALRPRCRRLMAIDDLADRPHEVDLLLDQNLGRRVGDYDALLPREAQRLVGPEFALLRPEFAEQRPVSLARRDRGQLQHLLFSMGGGDPRHATARALRALSTSALASDARITVVMGAQSSSLAEVTAEARALPWQCELRSDVSDMAALMGEADLAIGAAGGSAWERACLGLPSLLVVLADNQRPGTQALVAAGAARLLGTVDDLPAQLPAALQALAEPATLRECSRRAAALTDGQGTERVAGCIAAIA